jgi:hypothetical protein
VAHDVFISHSTEDKPVADAVCATLEQAGIRCWIAPRDIVPGTEWGAAIIDGIRQSSALVLVLSGAANGSAHIIREVERAVHLGIPVVPFRIEDVTPSGGLEYHLGSLHWLDALTPPLRAHMLPLTQTVQAIIGTARTPLPAKAQPRRSMRPYVLGSSAVVLAAALFFAKARLQRSPSGDVRSSAISDSGPGRATGEQRSNKSSVIPQRAQTRRVVPESDVLERVVGEYDDGARFLTVALEGEGKLSYYVPGETLHDLHWERDWRFRLSDVPEVVIEFIRGRDGTVTQLTVHDPRGIRIEVPRRSGEPPTRAVLEALTGEYGVEPPLARVTLQQGQLRLAIPGFPTYPLRFANGLHFAAEGYPTLSFEFVPDASGAISYLLVHQTSGNVSLPRKAAASSLEGDE